MHHGLATGYSSGVERKTVQTEASMRSGREKTACVLCCNGRAMRSMMLLISCHNFEHLSSLITLYWWNPHSAWHVCVKGIKSSVSLSPMIFRHIDRYEVSWPQQTSAGSAQWRLAAKVERDKSMHLSGWAVYWLIPHTAWPSVYMYVSMYEFVHTYCVCAYIYT